MTVVIQFGTILTASDTYQADILVEGEQIKAIGTDLAIPAGGTVHGEPVTLTVTFQGAAVVGAEVKVNGQTLPDITGQDGKVTFTPPWGARTVSIWAKKGQLEGTLVFSMPAP